MPSTLRISVVTATFNRAGCLPDCLRSVAAQTHPETEHIVQDGGSTDGSVAILHGAAAGLGIRFVSAPDTGLYDAINKGIARATGDIIGLMHSDDFFADPMVLAQVATLMEDPQIDGVYGDLDYVDARDTGRIVRKWRSGAYDAARLRQGWMPPHPTVYLRRSVFDTWGTYDTSYRIAADYDAMLRYLVKGQIRLAYLPQVMVKMRMGGESNASLAKILRKSREDYRSIRRNGVGGIGTLARKNLSKLTQFL